MDDHLDTRTEQALSHIERNGDLAWMDLPTPEVTRLYGELEAKGYAERNPWSGRLVLTESATQARKRSRDLDELIAFTRRISSPNS